MYSKLYEALGFRLVALMPGEKRPVHVNWQVNTKSDKIKKKHNMGVKLAYSGICCFDIDDLKALKSTKHGKRYWRMIRQGAAYTSGKPNRVKVLFRIKKPFPSIQLMSGAGELRCGTANGLTMQDVLPSSKLHDGRIYKWLSPEFLHWVPFDLTPKIPMLPKSIRKELKAVVIMARKKRRKIKRVTAYTIAYNEWFSRSGFTLSDFINKIGGYTSVFGGYRRDGSANRIAIVLYSDIDAFNFSTTEEQPIGHGPMDPYKLLELRKGKEEARKWVCNHAEIKDAVKKEFDKYYEGNTK